MGQKLKIKIATKKKKASNESARTKVKRVPKVKKI